MTAAERAQTLDALKPYPAYKDSGVEWIGDIPQGWDVVRLKSSASIVNARADEKPDNLRYLGLEHIESGTGGLTDAPDPLQVTSIVSLYNQGDVLFGKLRPYLMKVHLAEAPGCSSTEIIAFRCKADASPVFLKYWLLSHGLISTADMLTFGSKMPRVAPEQMANLPFVSAPTAEQVAIAAFLDHETARIDALVREQELLLEDLAEKRQATVNHATLAATPVDSPQLPVGWRNATLKTLLTSFEQGWSPQCDNRPAVEGEWGVLKVGCVNGHTFNAEENKVLPDDLEPLTRYSLKQDDVLISRANTRDLVGSAARVERDYPNLLLCDKLYRLRTDEAQLRPAYLVLLLNSPIARAAIETSASGASASMVNISQSTIRNLVFPIPPANEQDEIIAHLDQRVAQIDALVLEVRANIEDMKLLRSTLITAATTGKIDVRDWRPG